MWVNTAALAAALFLCAMSLCAAMPAQAQGRLSLSERVQRVEAQLQSQNSGQSVELLNRLNELQAEVQTLRGLVEQQAFEIESLKKAQRDRYVDLDSRLARLEGGAPQAMTPAPLSSDEPVTLQSPPPATPPQPGQLAMEEPAVTAPPADPALTTPSDEPPPPAAPTVPPAMDEKAAYDEAFATLREGRYAESARRFTAFLQQYPDGEYGDNARYWLGESYYVTQNYKIALDTFNSLLKRSPQSSKAPDALLKIGFCHYELRDWASAEASLNEVVTRYPDTTVARLAQGRLRALKLEGRQ
jgi:tol-pal system protein YbgF